MSIGKVSIHVTFLLLAVIMIALGFMGQFFIIFAVITIHELSHITAARIFGLRVSKFMITPLGEVANIDFIEKLDTYKKYIIILIGPFVNIFTGFMFLLFCGLDTLDFNVNSISTTNDMMQLIINYNFLIGFFNLIPVYPLDGAKAFQIFLGNKIGILKCNKVIHYLGKTGQYFLLFLGIVQVVLYPYNLSLVCIYSFFKITRKNEKHEMMFSFYRAVIVKKGRNISKLNTKVKVFMNTENIKAVASNLTWDNFHVICIVDNSNNLNIITEFSVIDYILENGMNNSLDEFIESYMDN